MEIREANGNDIPKIIEVLKASLGEKNLSISERIWHYKHLDNPFGNSFVLLAIEEGQVVGVRAFMRWIWQNEGETYSALRAVDTATHPAHQGKGIFKRLTLKAVEICKEKGDNLIFNTPNDQSRPGYLKMGWESAGNIIVGLKPALISFWNISSGIPKYSIKKDAETIYLEDLCTTWNRELGENIGIFTPKSAEFLKWRYEINPLQEYEVLSTEDVYIAAYVKKRGRIKELRISECIIRDKSNQKLVNSTISKWCSKFGVQVVSFSPKIQKISKFSVVGGFGPILTIKELNLAENKKSYFKDVNNWKYSIGDLELF